MVRRKTFCRQGYFEAAVECGSVSRVRANRERYRWPLWSHIFTNDGRPAAAAERRAKELILNVSLCVPFACAVQLRYGLMIWSCLPTNSSSYYLVFGWHIRFPPKDKNWHRPGRGRTQTRWSGPGLFKSRRSPGRRTLTVTISLHQRLRLPCELC